jgi:hypothetical protein
MKLKTLLFFIILFGFYACSKSDETKNSDDFCTKTRIENSLVVDKEATLVFFEDKQKYALKITPPENLIDTDVNCFVCEKPSGIEINDKVKFSGILYDFLESENYTPQIGGQEFYFLQTQNLIKIQ